jgi:hypothetical protein
VRVQVHEHSLLGQFLERVLTQDVGELRPHWTGRQEWNRRCAD